MGGDSLGARPASPVPKALFLPVAGLEYRKKVRPSRGKFRDQSRGDHVGKGKSAGLQSQKNAVEENRARKV